MRFDTMSLAERMFSGFEVRANGCWEWARHRNKYGYGEIRVNGRQTLAHRAMLHLVGREMPKGMQIDHLCRNRGCVNPDHLEVVTPLENSLRGNSLWGINSRKTHCLNGHEFTEENTRITWAKGRRRRHCLACDRERSNRKRAAARASTAPPPGPTSAAGDVGSEVSGGE